LVGKAPVERAYENAGSEVAKAMICTAEKVTRGDARNRAHYICHSERFRDVLYPDVAERVPALTEATEPGSRPALAVDATGVGAAVVDILRHPEAQSN
jgi:hypothetical protein